MDMYVDAFDTGMKYNANKCHIKAPPIELITDRPKAQRLYDIIFYLTKLTDIIIFCLLVYGLYSSFIVQPAAMTRFDFVHLLDSCSTWARKVPKMDTYIIADLKERLATFTRLCGATLKF